MITHSSSLSRRSTRRCCHAAAAPVFHRRRRAACPAAPQHDGSVGRGLGRRAGQDGPPERRQRGRCGRVGEGRCAEPVPRRAHRLQRRDGGGPARRRAAEARVGPCPGAQHTRTPAPPAPALCKNEAVILVRCLFVWGRVGDESRYCYEVAMGWTEVKVKSSIVPPTCTPLNRYAGRPAASNASWWRSRRSAVHTVPPTIWKPFGNDG